MNAAKIGALLLAVALIAPIFLSTPALYTAAAQPTTITIGALLPLTGDLQSYGVRAQAAVQVAVEDVNAYLESKNAWFRFELKVEDTQTKPDVAVQKFNSLVAQGIKFIVGPMTSAEVKKLKDLADQNNVLIISPSSTAIELKIAGDNVFRFCPTDDVQSKAIGALVRDLGIKGVVIINRADTWGNGLMEATKEVLEGEGVEVASVYSYNPESPNFSGIASQANGDMESLVSKYGEDKVAVVAIGFKEVVELFSAAADYETLEGVLWIGSDGTAQLSEFTTDPLAREFATSTLFINPIFSPAATAAQEKVRQEVVAKIGEEPDAYSLAAYDAVWAIALALLQAGPMDNPDEMVNQVKQLLPQITTSDEFAKYAATGKFPLDEGGDRATADYDWYIVAEVGGEYKWVKAGVYKGVEDKNEWVTIEGVGKTFPQLFQEKFAAAEETTTTTTPSPTQATSPTETPEETETAEEGGVSTTLIAAIIIVVIVLAAAAYFFLRSR
ncbi:ABC transporter substrate-binding protein [Aeropyrum camini]|uniref:Branched-chain amino acid ABC transporter n=1 Tax=Aeropyrum camini SY1 = JCM 12091 TaxID=1198449 RepID=U3TFG3_9CREN|nr:ABC transporter substrate-binding protein [Aeropyrum camini]BAN90069.1 branched-chain amino acid ABC transporter [Aeropyrum camini SY1 = JCM 12091]